MYEKVGIRLSYRQPHALIAQHALAGESWTKQYEGTHNLACLEKRFRATDVMFDARLGASILAPTQNETDICRALPHPKPQGDGGSRDESDRFPPAFPV